MDIRLKMMIEKVTALELKYEKLKRLFLEHLAESNKTCTVERAFLEDDK